MPNQVDSAASGRQGKDVKTHLSCKVLKFASIAWLTLISNGCYLHAVGSCWLIIAKSQHLCMLGVPRSETFTSHRADSYYHLAPGPFHFNPYPMPLAYFHLAVAAFPLPLATCTLPLPQPQPLARDRYPSPLPNSACT